MSSLLIKNARYLGDSVDLLVVDGKVQSLSASINAPADAEIVDAAGKILFPSFIDVHTHLREPGYEWKETVATGLSSAAHGGFGAILCMANTDPVNDDAAVTEQILESARRSWPNGPRVHPIGAATVGLKGEELTRMSELKDAGCVAISNDGRPVGNTEIFRRMLEYAADLDLIVIDHCEDPYLAAKSHMNEGATSGVLGVKGQPDVAETIQASRSILLADYLGVPVHIAHVSAKRTVDIIAWGKSRGVKVTAEKVCLPRQISSVSGPRSPPACSTCRSTPSSPARPPTSSFSILSSNGRSRPRPSTPRATIPRGSVSPSRAASPPTGSAA